VAKKKRSAQSDVGRIFPYEIVKNYKDQARAKFVVTAIESDSSIKGTVVDELFPAYLTLRTAWGHRDLDIPTTTWGISRYLHVLSGEEYQEQPDDWRINLEHLLLYAEQIDLSYEYMLLRDFSIHLATWATKYNLNTDWVLDVVLYYFALWCSPNDKKRLRTSLLSSEQLLARDGFIDVSNAVPGVTRVFEMPHYIPPRELQTSYRQRVIEQFLQHLDAYIESRNAIAASWDLGPDFVVNLKNDAHFLRLAKYQVLGQSYSKISEDEGVSWQAIYKSVNKLAIFIHLTLREETPGGRPKKQLP
jgi:hypothetical protein